MSVSILIPAYRGDYLSQAISSVLCQTHTDFELIISDDSSNSDVAVVVDSFKDGRITYSRTAGNQGAMKNIKTLWKKANREYVKFLFDDDFLMPMFVRTCLDTMSNTKNSFCFTNRLIVDQNGRVLAKPASVQENATAVVDGKMISQSVVAHIANGIGELSNVIINRGAGVCEADITEYRGYEISVLGDVSCYLNLTKRAPAIGIGQFLSAFRRHDKQNSSPAFNPRFSAGLFEWDLFARGEFESGYLTSENAEQACSRLASIYAEWRRIFPELTNFAEHLDQFRKKIILRDRAVLDDQFFRNWDEARSTIDDRVAARKLQRVAVESGSF